jgi:hypothetical protein
MDKRLEEAIRKEIQPKGGRYTWHQNIIRDELKGGSVSDDTIEYIKRKYGLVKEPKLMEF